MARERPIQARLSGQTGREDSPVHDRAPFFGVAARGLTFLAPAARTFLWLIAVVTGRRCHRGALELSAGIGKVGFQWLGSESSASPSESPECLATGAFWRADRAGCCGWSLRRADTAGQSGGGIGRFGRACPLPGAAPARWQACGISAPLSELFRDCARANTCACFGLPWGGLSEGSRRAAPRLDA